MVNAVNGLSAIEYLVQLYMDCMREHHEKHNLIRMYL